MVSISTLQTAVFTVGPFLVPKLLSFYRTQSTKAATAPVAVQPVPKPVRQSLNILFVSAALALCFTASYFNPENIFRTTSSRLQTPNDVLFTRLAAVRGTSGLTPDDETLKPKLASLDSRCLYLTYGPDVVTHCTFCMSDEPLSYLLFALPSLLLPHILHLLALGLATSNMVGGSQGKKWRSSAVLIGVALAGVEVYSYAMYDWKSNARALRPEEYIYFYEWMKVVRGISITMGDAGLAAFLWLSGTNRAFITPPTPAERLETSLKTLEQARGKVNALGIMRNAVVRDEGMRRRVEGYWIREGKIIGEVMDEREVVECVRNALTERVQVAKVEEDARRFADTLIPSQPVPMINTG